MVTPAKFTLRLYWDTGKWHRRIPERGLPARAQYKVSSGSSLSSSKDDTVPPSPHDDSGQCGGADRG